MVSCRKRRGGTPTGERAPPCPPRTWRKRRSRRAAASDDADGRNTRLSAFRLPDFFVVRARSRWSRYHRRRSFDGIGPGVFWFFVASWSKTRTQTRRENVASLRAQRSNPALRAKMDCFVASAPRNDGCGRAARTHGLRHSERSEAIELCAKMDCFVASAPRNDV